MISEKVMSVLNDRKNFRDATVTVSVEMMPSALMDKLAEEVVYEVERIGVSPRLTDVSKITVDVMRRYLCTLVWMRVNWVNHLKNKSTAPYAGLESGVAVPVMAYQLLIAIGEAFDSDFAIRFVPSYPIGEDDLLSANEVLEVSDILTRLENIGMKVVYGLPKDVEGELDFMALHHVGELVKGYRSSHPVYGFYAAFFQQKEFNEITGMMCRVLYGYDTDYKMYLTSVMRALGV